MGPPPESSSKGKRLVDEDDDYNPDKDLNQTVSKLKKQRVSRHKFVTKSSRSLVQEGVNILNTIFSQATTTTTQASASMSTPPVPTITSTQVTPDTQRLLDELINTPPAATSSSPFMTIPVSASNVSPSRSSPTTISTSNFSREQDDNAYMIESLNASFEKVLKQLAAQGEISCRQENVIIPDNDDDDIEGAQEDVEIEFEQDDEVVKYATHEGVEFGASFIDQINNLAQDETEAEEGEIVGRERK
ncbi:hypothetical protein L1987_15479 [Smallanthus sonchifolius]|uniref:Uncharacterized protein n=1 Tax=Smallanthus sonchifolius TaxID=185202 RepID=A0ACB9J624_9ASTR|nr:hypothetical protein L1987_15479 [Smallanthus sonchifolius]